MEVPLLWDRKSTRLTLTPQTYHMVGYKEIESIYHFDINIY